MAANSPRKRKQGGAAPLPISALPLPVDNPAPAEEAAQPEASLPTNSSGELTPAQRARLGLDIYGDDPAPPPTPITNANGATPAPVEPAQPTDFGFAEMDPFEQPAAPAEAEPRLAPAAPMPAEPRLAPAASTKVRVSTRASLDDHEDPDENAGSRTAKRRQQDDGIDPTEQIDRDRNVLTYGISWTFFCLFVTAALSFSSTFSSGNSGPTPGTFVPALVSIVIGWVVVFVGRNMKNWGWLMLAPAVVLVLGPFFYTSWRIGQIETTARAYLSPAGETAEIDIDARSIVSQTINTDTGCFAFTQDRETNDTRVDVVTYQPQTAQQQATYSLAPRYARRVDPGGERATSRSFTLAKGALPVVVEEHLTAPIDCANSSGP